MSNLAIPKNVNGVMPNDWWKLVLAEVKTVDSFDELNEFETMIRQMIVRIESRQEDTLDYEKALRVVEYRRGVLLGPRGKGGRGQTLSRVKEFDGAKASRWRAIAENWKLLYPTIVEATKATQVTQTQMLRLIREHTPAKPSPEVTDETKDERVTLLHGDFRDRLETIDPGSVDAIVTDPPYPKEDLPLYSDLSKVAARLLGPRGILFVWTGQIFLPEVLDRLAEHLNYGWTFTLTLPGSGSRIMGRHIIQAWKPVVAFTVGKWPSGKWGDDLLVSPSREKSDYEWEQNAAPALRLIERYTPPDGLIVDPFLGVGSFGIAAVRAGRRFLGVELDAGRFAKASERIIQ